MQLEENVPVRTGNFRLLTVILIAVFSLAIGGVGGYWVGSRQQQFSETALQTSPNPSWLPSAPPVQSLSLTPTVATNFISITPIDLQTGWKTHQDLERDFIVKYPASWHLSYPAPKDFFGVTTITTYDPRRLTMEREVHRRLTSSDLKVLLFWSYENPPAGQPLRSWVQKQASKAMVLIISLSEMRIGGRIVLRSVERATGAHEMGDLLVTYYIPHKNRVLIVNVRPNDSIHLPTLEHIIENLQFAD